MLISNFSIQFNQENIFRMLQCFKDSEVYDLFLDEYKKIEKIAYTKINAKAILEFGEMPGEFSPYKKMKKDVLYVLFSIGAGLPDFTSSLFEKNEFVQGFIVDAIADDYLFQMDNQLKREIIALCIQKNVHITKRLEAPISIPIEMQKVAFEVCNAEKLMSIQINESYMLDPIKTMCIVYELEKGIGEFKLDHECRKCDCLDCPTREFNEVKIKIIKKDKVKTATYYGGETLLDFLTKHDFFLSAMCGGKGTCGKCKIRMIEGELELTDADYRYFSKAELDQGFRLACQAYPNKDCTIEIRNDEESMYIPSQLGKKECVMCGEFGIAIDIGTTTIAMALVSLESGEVVDHFTSINHQRILGADVISRILASNEGNNYMLQETIIQDLFLGIDMLTKSFKNELGHIVISGNTTMIHLLMNYNCKRLGEYPYIPENLRMINSSGKEMFEQLFLNGSIPNSVDFSVMVMPGISAFVGGDIVSGLYYLKYDAKNEVNLFIDLGTNGELAIGNRNKILCTSTAVGPAFEGGNLSSGVASIAGAICKIEIGKKIHIQTIYDEQPIGICGTGIIEGISELLEQGLIDETGLLKEPYFTEGYQIANDQYGNGIKILQKDIREIQLAKAAVAAGIETLVEEFGVEMSGISHIYIAGGFGYQLDISKAKRVGILPEIMNAKISMVGNASLLGAIKILKQNKEKKVEKIVGVKKIIEVAKELNLAQNDTFQKKYLEHMYF